MSLGVGYAEIKRCPLGERVVCVVRWADTVFLPNPCGVGIAVGIDEFIQKVDEGLDSGKPNHQSLDLAHPVLFGIHGAPTTASVISES